MPSFGAKRRVEQWHQREATGDGVASIWDIAGRKRVKVGDG